MMDKKSEQGVITLEACVSVLSFLVLMFLLSSLFIMFMAQNVTAHTILQSAQSLSLDVYTIEQMGLDNGELGSVGEVLGGWITKMFGKSSNNPYFVSDTRWYEKDSTEIAKTVRNRFIGYIAGSGEDAEQVADELLEQMNIVDGLDGLDFSKSYVANDVLYIVLCYELEYDFNMWNVKNVQKEQKACAKLWN